MLLLLILLNTHSMSMGADFAATPTIRVQEWQDFSALRVGDVVCFSPSPMFYHSRCYPVECKNILQNYTEKREGRGYFTTSNTNLVCHRIFWRNSTIAFTKGDSNKYPDFGYVDRKNYVGVVR